MKILGIEFNGRHLHYVLLDVGETDTKVTTANRLTLSETRAKDALRAFQDAVQAMYKSTKPEQIAIKSKPEKGAMSAGAASLKMEGIGLANAPCDVEFVSAHRIAKCAESELITKKYLMPAYKAAASSKKIS